MSAPPIPMQWTGDALVPLPRFAREADRHYTMGEVTLVAPVEERSEVSHRHEFAWIKSAWMSLPENLADDFPTSEHLRKRALVATGFYDEQIIDAGTQAAALRVAMGVRSFPGEDFSHVVTRGGLVVIRRPKSQSRRAMDKDEWQASKTAILEWVAALIEVTPEQLSKQGQGPGSAEQASPVASHA